MAKIKNFFSKIKIWFKNHKPTKRRIIQLYAALLINSNIKGFFTGKIYRGPSKNLCVPGLNCYSCPGAVGACPMGSLQNALASSGTRLPFYIFGIIILLGLSLGRTICGFLCPMGLGQELLYKIKTPKLKKSRVTHVLSYLKYIILALAIIIPVLYHGIPFFCKYICPAGTFEGGIGLLQNIKNSDFFGMLGYLFTWKFALLVIFIVASIFIFRFFCRFFCPLGAIYGFFSKIALLGIKLDKSACIECGLCLDTCKMDIRRVGDHECIQCGDCVSVCPTNAISWKGSKIFIHPSEVAPVKEEVKTETESVQQEMPSVVKTEKKKLPRMQRILKITGYVLAGVLLIGSLLYYNVLAPKDTTVVYKVGDKCREFTLELYDTQATQETFSIYESRGKVTVINYWETTCDPCVEEIPWFEEVNKEYAGEINMVAVHSYHVTENVQAFIDNHGWNEYTMMLALDTEELNTFVMLGGKYAYPITVILDEDGVITCINQGKMEKEVLIREIEKARGN